MSATRWCTHFECILSMSQIELNETNDTEQMLEAILGLVQLAHVDMKMPKSWHLAH